MRRPYRRARAWLCAWSATPPSSRNVCPGKRHLGSLEDQGVSSESHVEVLDEAPESNLEGCSHPAPVTDTAARSPPFRERIERRPPGRVAEPGLRPQSKPVIRNRSRYPASLRLPANGSIDNGSIWGSAIDTVRVRDRSAYPSLRSEPRRTTSRSNPDCRRRKNVDAGEGRSCSIFSAPGCLHGKYPRPALSGVVASGKLILPPVADRGRGGNVGSGLLPSSPSSAGVNASQ